MSHRAIGASLLLVVVAVASARGDEDVRQRARTLYESGTTHYNLREFGDALKDFKEAYRLRPDPVFLFNIAQCYRQTNEPEQAASYYRTYRRELPNAPNRTEVDRLIVEMDKAATELRARQPPVGTQPPSEGQPQAQPPPPAQQQAAPPPAAAAVVATAPPPPPERPVYKKPWFWVTIGAAAVVVAGGITLGVVLGSPKDPKASLGRVQGP